jgi:hypothetical protein
MKRWAWKEDPRHQPLAIGDAFLQGVLPTQTWAPSTAFALTDGVMQVAGLEIHRRGLMRAERVVFEVPWSQVESFQRGRIPPPEHIEQWRRPKDDVVAVRVGRIGAGRDMILIVLQNLDQWCDALTANEIQQLDDF